MGKIILAILVLFICGCGSTTHLVSEIDGCKVYRIEDIGGYHYFSNCGVIK